MRPTRSLRAKMTLLAGEAGAAGAAVSAVEATTGVEADEAMGWKDESVLDMDASSRPMSGEFCEGFVFGDRTWRKNEG